MLAFNAPNSKIILHSRFVMASPCPNPSTSTAGSIDAILTGTLGPANKAGYGKALNVPNIDTQPLPLKDFVTTVSKGSYVQARCSATPLRMQTVFTYSGAGQAPDTANATQACSN